MGIFDDDKKKDQQAFGLFNFMNEMQDDNSEEDLDDYGLTDEEKELVEKGEQDPWNFDEEDLEDDDYYEEDDD